MLPSAPLSIHRLLSTRQMLAPAPDSIPSRPFPTPLVSAGGRRRPSSARFSRARLAPASPQVATSTPAKREPHEPCCSPTPRRSRPSLSGRFAGQDHGSTHPSGCAVHSFPVARQGVGVSGDLPFTIANGRGASRSQAPFPSLRSVPRRRARRRRLAAFTEHHHPQTKGKPDVQHTANWKIGPRCRVA